MNGIRCADVYIYQGGGSYQKAGSMDTLHLEAQDSHADQLTNIRVSHVGGSSWVSVCPFRDLGSFLTSKKICISGEVRAIVVYPDSSTRTEVIGKATGLKIAPKNNTLFEELID